MFMMQAQRHNTFRWEECYYYFDVLPLLSQASVVVTGDVFNIIIMFHRPKSACLLLVVVIAMKNYFA